MRLSERFEDALVYATRLHGAQSRKGSSVPYVAHLLWVAALVLEHGGSEDEAIAALLHDAVEDQGGARTRAEILARFGPTVTEIVDGCTDSETSPKPAWQTRKEAHLACLASATPSVRLVVAADKLANVRTMLRAYRQRGDSLWAVFTGGKDGTLWYYRAAAELLAQGGTNLLVDELLAAVAELETLVGLRNR